MVRGGHSTPYKEESAAVIDFPSGAGRYTAITDACPLCCARLAGSAIGIGLNPEGFQRSGAFSFQPPLLLDMLIYEIGPAAVSGYWNVRIRLSRHRVGVVSME